MANDLSYHKVYLCHFFKSKTNITITDYFYKLKVHAARKYLESNECLMEYVSDLYGFSSPSHFTKNFKKEFGLTPAQYSKYYH